MHRRKEKQAKDHSSGWANMSGSEKFPLLVIGNSKRPHAFKKKKIPVTYKANSKAWMTTELLEEMLRAWDGRLS